MHPDDGDAEGVPVLTTDRLVLRAHVPSDLDDYAGLWANAAVVRYITGAPSSRSETWSRLLRHVGHWRTLGFGYWVIADRATGRLLGEAGFANYKREMEPPLGDVPEHGWLLAPHAQGRGLASEAIAATLQWADRRLSADRTVCMIAPDNAASIRVASKAGYRERGTSVFKGERTLVMERPSA